MSSSRADDDDPPHTGGCFCGAVRYACTALCDAGYCHCTICRRVTGAPVFAWVNVRPGDFRLQQGMLKPLQSSPKASRYLCPDCGTALYTAADHDPQWLSLSLCSLDDPEVRRPAVHICADSALSWLSLDDGLPRYPGADLPPPEER